MSAGYLLISKLSEEETKENQQGPSGSHLNSNREPVGNDEEEEPMDQDLSAKEDGDKKQ